jgi:hypothetical protein
MQAVIAEADQLVDDRGRRLSYDEPVSAIAWRGDEDNRRKTLKTVVELVAVLVIFIEWIFWLMSLAYVGDSGLSTAVAVLSIFDVVLILIGLKQEFRDNIGTVSSEA